MANLLERAVRRAARSAVPRSLLGGFVAAVVPLILAVAPVAAHGETFFQLGAERVQPGGSVEVRADLGAGEAFDLTLIGRGDGARRFLATLAATEEGHLQTYLTIPADVAAGEYLVEIAYDVTVLRAPLTVAGAPIAGEEGQLPGQDEGIGVLPARVCQNR